MIRKPEITITARYKKDKKSAKILEEMINKDWQRYRYVMSQILSARSYIESVYGIVTPDSIWNKIMNEVVFLDVERRVGG